MRSRLTTEKSSGVTSFLRQFADKHALRPAVAFAERMYAVKLNHDTGGALREFFAAKAAQIVFVAELFGKAIQSVHNQGAIHEGLTVCLAQDGLVGGSAIGQHHVFIACSARPFVNILKKMAVNSFEMRRIKLSVGGLDRAENPKGGW